MDFFDVFKVVKRAKLKFGEPLDEVCKNGIIHDSLKDLFLKAYLSAKGDENSDDALSTVLLAIKAGARGQGTVAQRMLLKSKLELGEWILPAQTPPGAPLWLLRHFLGRLPEPLLKGSHWKALGEACRAALRSPDTSTTRQVLERIAVSSRALNQVEYKILALLTLLIRKFTFQKQVKELEEEEEEEVSEEDALNALAQYFIGSIIARPYRPGLFTALDKECKTILVFLVKYWRVVFQKAPTSASIANFSKKKNYFGVSYEYSRNSRASIKEKKNHNRFIGFESLLIIQDNEESKESSDNDSDTDCLCNGEASSDPSIIKRNFIKLKQKNSSSSREENSTINAFENKTLIDEDQTLEAVPKFKIETDKRNILIPAKSNGSNNSLRRVETLRDVNEIEKSISERFETDISEDSLYYFEDNEFKGYENFVKPSSAEYEFFSVPNSEDSQ